MNMECKRQSWSGPHNPELEVGRSPQRTEAGVLVSLVIIPSSRWAQLGTHF